MSTIELTRINEPIKFSDPEVKRRCIKAGWDLDGDGEISYAEASIVKDIGRIFSESCVEDDYKGTRIKSFNEFQFFVGIEKIPDWAFGSCSSLQSILLPCTIKSIGEYAFYGTALKSVTLPEGLTTIDTRAFEHSELETIYIPRSIQRMGDNPFYECPKLWCFEGQYASNDGRCLIDGVELVAFAPYGIRDYCVPETVEHVGYGVFAGCHFSMLRLPSTLSSVGEYAFADCEGALYINSNIEDGWFILNRFSTVIFGSDVTEVGNCMSYSEHLDNVIFEAPNNITSIRDGAFSHCTSLMQISLPPNIKSIGKGAFNKCGLISIEIPDTIVKLTDQLFAECENLKFVKFGENTKEIGSLCFAECKNLERLVIPNGVTTISDGAFSGCSSLKEVSFPESLEIINDSAFEDCERIIGIHLPESLKKIGKRAFKGCRRVRTITFPSSSLFIDKYAFCECGVPAVATNIDDTELLVHYLEESVFDTPVGVYPIWNSSISVRYRKKLIALRKEQTKQKPRRSFDDIIDEEEFKREMIEDGLAEAFNSDDSSRWNIE